MKSRRGRNQQDPQASPAGSPEPGGPVFLVVGKLRRSHGINGEIQMEVITDFPDHIKPGREFYYGEEHTPIQLTGRRPHGQLMILSFEGFEEPESVRVLTNQLLYIKRDALPPLPEGEYYHFQLVGLNVVTEDGEPLGVLREILETGSNDVYVVEKPAGGEMLLPVREEVILNVDLDRGEMRVKPPEWLD